MRKVAHGVVWFAPDVAKRVLELMKLQCSAVRSASQALTKGLVGNAVTTYVKRNYMADLNQRYLLDACTLAAQAGGKRVLHGGRKAWRQLQTGEISKTEWVQRRNSSLYARGDRARQGNPHIRICGNRLLVRDPVGRWLEGRLYIPAKFRLNLGCYGVQILLRNGRFRVVVLWEEAALESCPTSGVLAVDANPGGLGLAAVNAAGALRSQTFLSTPRLPVAGQAKRDYDVRAIAKGVVVRAAQAGQAVAIEKLRFAPHKRAAGSRKFKRMKHNFVYRKLLEAIKARCLKQGVPCIEVEPAFTSILGMLKYEKMYSLNRHTAAAYVIGRRALGHLERVDYRVSQTGKGGRTRVNLEGRSRSHTLSPKAASWLHECFVQPKPALLTGATPGTGVTPRHCESGQGEIPCGESSVRTGRGGESLDSGSRKGT